MNVKRFIVVTINRTRRDGIDTHLVVDTDAEEVMASCRSKLLAQRIAEALEVTPGQREEPF